MPCYEEKTIRSFLDDVLEEWKYQTLRAHLEECSACRRFTQGLDSTTYRLKEMTELSVPRELLSYARTKAGASSGRSEVAAVTPPLFKPPSAELATREAGASKPFKKRKSDWVPPILPVLLLGLLASEFAFLYFREKGENARHVRYLLDSFTRAQLDQKRAEEIRREAKEKTPASPVPSPSPVAAAVDVLPELPVAEPEPMPVLALKTGPVPLPPQMQLPPPPFISKKKHLHVPVDRNEQLFTLIKETESAILYDDAESFLVLLVPRGNWMEFQRRCRAIHSEHVLDFTGWELPENFDGEEVEVSIHLTQT